MKILIATLATETNTFSPMPTGALAFAEGGMVTREATLLPGNLFTAPLHEWRTAAEARGWEVVESLSAVAQPSGITVRAVYEGFRDEILEDIRTAQPDIVLLSMHGAMVAQGYDDCEGDMLSEVRAIVGPSVVVGLEIDPHHSLTDLMLANANLIVAYKEYPHVDSPDRARELFALAADTAEGKITPVMRDYDCRMLTMYHTPKQPMRGFVDAMKAREGTDGVLSLSLSHGFPWCDVERVGTRMLAITDGDADKAASVAQEFGQTLWALRDQLNPDWPSIEQALDHVQAATARPIVLADFADNAGGGAPSDSSYFLEAILARGMKDVAIGMIWDPVLVGLCRDAGPGAKMRVRVCGKISKASGNSVDLDVTVRAVKENMTLLLGDVEMAVGNAVWLDADGVHLVINDVRNQNFNPSAFTDLGIPIDQMKALVVKSSQHFYDQYVPVAAEIVQVAGPGAITPDFANIPFTKRDGRYWPKIENPFDDTSR